MNLYEYRELLRDSHSVSWDLLEMQEVTPDYHVTEHVTDKERADFRQQFASFFADNVNETN